MSYTGNIIINNSTGSEIMQWSFEHKSGNFNNTLSSGRIINGGNTSIIKIESQPGTIYDSWTIRFTISDPTIHNSPGLTKKADIKFLWGRNDNGGNANLVLYENFARLTTPSGSTQMNY